MNVTFRQLQLFRALVSTGSISGAAKEANVTQPTASVHLRDLSEAVGDGVSDGVHMGLTGSFLQLTLLQIGKRVSHHSLDSCAGPIPTDIGQLVSLQTLDLRYNGLTGKHPSAHI